MMITIIMVLVVAYLITLFGLLDSYLGSQRHLRYWVVGFAVSCLAICLTLDYLRGV